MLKMIKKDLGTLLYSTDVTMRCLALETVHKSIADSTQLIDDVEINAVSRIAIYNCFAKIREEQQYTLTDIYLLVAESQLVEYHAFMSRYNEYLYRLYNAIYNLTDDYARHVDES